MRVYLLMGDVSYIVELLQFLNSYKECKWLLFSQMFHLDFIYKYICILFYTCERHTSSSVLLKRKKAWCFMVLLFNTNLMTIALMLMSLKEYKPVDKGVLEPYW